MSAVKSAPKSAPKSVKTATAQLLFAKQTPGAVQFKSAPVAEGESRPLVTQQYLTKDGLREIFGIDLDASAGVEQGNCPAIVTMTITVSGA